MILWQYETNINSYFMRLRVARFARNKAEEKHSFALCLIFNSTTYI